MKLERIQLWIRRVRKALDDAGTASFSKKRPQLGKVLRFLLAAWDFLTRWRSDEAQRDAKPSKK